MENIIELYNNAKYKEVCDAAEQVDVEALDSDQLYKAACCFKKCCRNDMALKFFMLAASKGGSDECLKNAAELALAQNNMEALKNVIENMSSNSALEYEYYVYSFKYAQKTNAPTDEQIDYVEKIVELSYDGNYMYTLAELYHRSGNTSGAKRMCKKIINFFSDELCVEKARDLLDEITGVPKAEAAPIAEEIIIPRNIAASAPNQSGVMTDNADDDGMPEELKKYFDGFIGMKTVKEQIVKIYNTVKIQMIREQMLKEEGIDISANQRGCNFILLGNPGTGKTSVARIISEILADLGIRQERKLVETDRSEIVSDHIGGTAQNMRTILERAKGGTLFIDEAYSLYKEDCTNDFGVEAIDVLLKDMEDHRDEYSVILAGYSGPMKNMLKKANSGFSSRFTYTIEIPDYSDDELIAIAHLEAARNAYTFSEDADYAIKKAISRERLDDTFGNARFVRELINRARENQATRLTKMKTFSRESLSILTAEDIFPDMEDEGNVKEYLDRLHELIGLESVKKEVQSIIDRLTVNKEMERLGLKPMGEMGTMHMSFLGNAGTGKTTVARLLGKIYAALGILKRGDVFVECSRADLIGKYQGHTAANVKDVVHSALGGILFIDEAYSIVQDPNDSFGKEALDTLVAEIENNRANFMVIFAGYSGDMQVFFEKNQGLRSRVPTDLVFDDYSQEELFDVFKFMLRQKELTATDEALEEAKNIIFKESAGSDFGNARGVRNIVDKVIKRQNSRLADKLHNGISVSKEDFGVIEYDDMLI